GYPLHEIVWLFMLLAHISSGMEEGRRRRRPSLRLAGTGRTAMPLAVVLELHQRLRAGVRLRVALQALALDDFDDRGLVRDGDRLLVPLLGVLGRRADEQSVRIDRPDQTVRDRALHAVDVLAVVDLARRPRRSGRARRTGWSRRARLPRLTW